MKHFTKINSDSLLSWGRWGTETHSRAGRDQVVQLVSTEDQKTLWQRTMLQSNRHRKVILPLVCCSISLQVLSDLSGWKTRQVQLKYLEIKPRSVFTLPSLRSKYYSLGPTLRKTPPQSSYCLRSCSLKMLSAVTITDVIANPQTTCAKLSKSRQMRFCIHSREPGQSPLVVCPWRSLLLEGGL